MSSISKLILKKELELSTPITFVIFVITSFLSLTLRFLNYSCFLPMLCEGSVSALIAQALRLLMNLSSLLNIHHDID